jgi:hypothetical protein
MSGFLTALAAARCSRRRQPSPLRDGELARKGGLNKTAWRCVRVLAWPQDIGRKTKVPRPEGARHNRLPIRVGRSKRPSVVGTDPPVPAPAPPAAVVIAAPVDANSSTTASEESATTTTTTSAAASTTSTAAPTPASKRRCGAGRHDANGAETVDCDQSRRCQKACDEPRTATCDRCLHVCFLHVPGALEHSFFQDVRRVRRNHN